MAGQPTLILTRTIHVWYIYLHLVDLFMVNVGKYTIHGCYGNVSPPGFVFYGMFFLFIGGSTTNYLLGPSQDL